MVRAATNLRFSVTVIGGPIVAVGVTGLATGGRMDNQAVAVLAFLACPIAVFKTAKYWVMRGNWPADLG